MKVCCQAEFNPAASYSPIETVRVVVRRSTCLKEQRLVLLVWQLDFVKSFYKVCARETTLNSVRLCVLGFHFFKVILVHKFHTFDLRSTWR
jgi:hypothetical protein